MASRCTRPTNPVPITAVRSFFIVSPVCPTLFRARPSLRGLDRGIVHESVCFVAIPTYWSALLPHLRRQLHSHPHASTLEDVQHGTLWDRHQHDGRRRRCGVHVGGLRGANLPNHGRRHRRARTSSSFLTIRTSRQQHGGSHDKRKPSSRHERLILIDHCRVNEGAIPRLVARRSCLDPRSPSAGISARVRSIPRTRRDSVRSRRSCGARR